MEIVISSYFDDIVAATTGKKKHLFLLSDLCLYRDAHNCVRLEIPNIGQLIQPHSCYKGTGGDYRGTHSMTR